MNKYINNDIYNGNTNIILIITIIFTNISNEYNTIYTNINIFSKISMRF